MKKKIVCIVGSYKWADEHIPIAKKILRTMFRYLDPERHEIISGECHKGGIDIWAKELALQHGFAYRGFPAAEHELKSYMRRNMAMACVCDILFRIESPISRTKGSKKTLWWAEERHKQCFEICIFKVNDKEVPCLKVNDTVSAILLNIKASFSNKLIACLKSL